MADNTFPLRMLKGLSVGDSTDDSSTDASKSTPDEANYDGPDQGPFRCDNCEYFISPGSCQKVQGSIDPAGCCNYFEKGESSDVDSGATRPDGLQRGRQGEAPGMAPYPTHP